NRVVANGYSVAGVGYLRWSDRDAIPQAADFLLTEENVHTSVVYGLLDEQGGREAISGSLRTHKSTLRVDRFLKDALGDDLAGGGGRAGGSGGGGPSAGGRLGEGGGFPPGGGGRGGAARDEGGALRPPHPPQALPGRGGRRPGRSLRGGGGRGRVNPSAPRPT